MRKNTLFMCFSLVTAAGVVACSGAGREGATLEVGSTSSALSSPAGAPPAASPLGPHIEVTVTEVTAHIAGADQGSEGAEGSDKGKLRLPGAAPAPGGDDGSGADGWVVLFRGRETISLGDPSGVEAILGAGPIPAGKVTQIRLVLADATYVSGETRTPIACPSCSESGLKIVTRGKVTIPYGGVYHVTLAFDANASLEVDGSGYRLEPTIKIDDEALR